tara:strand:- start:200 stop:1330 length:1131 start_codon:yes stop_codon:yes gene_type:complete
MENAMKDEDSGSVLKTTPLDCLHQSLNARMMPFAGYSLPLQYGSGIITEHNHTRAKASLFDVSHMGQIRIHGADAAEALETIVPSSIDDLEPGGMRYTMLTTDVGTIIDDVMVTREDDGLFVVVNASRLEFDLPHMRAKLGADVEFEILKDRALIALQGPKAAAALADLSSEVTGMPFMSARTITIDRIETLVNRCGYTGEDGFEISIPADSAEDLVRALLADDRVEMAGLGARDTLRLEAGLCLYGQDIDEKTTPIEAGLNWTIAKRRREEGGFPGANVIVSQIADGPTRRLVGIRPEGRVPARAGTTINTVDGEPLGEITSGAFGPTIGGPVAMGYVAAGSSDAGTAVQLDIRGKTVPAAITTLPFTPRRYFKS